MEKQWNIWVAPCRELVFQAVLSWAPFEGRNCNRTHERARSLHSGSRDGRRRPSLHGSIYNLCNLGVGSPV
jgi:hypothetical protein